MNINKEDPSKILLENITSDWLCDSWEEKLDLFLDKECRFENDNNHYLIDRFSMNVRVSLNKNIKNKQP
jgi:hypothetical protein